MPWKFTLNAPRQGLFASLLIVSFALHTFLLVLATTHQLNANRASQGQLMTSQLVTDSLSELEPANTVSLALLADRYATNPSVASIRILDANNQVLATGGLTKTRQGEVFVREALQMKRKWGSIEITPDSTEYWGNFTYPMAGDFTIAADSWLVMVGLSRHCPSKLYRIFWRVLTMNHASNMKFKP